MHCHRGLKTYSSAAWRRACGASTGKGHSGGPGIIEVMSKSHGRRFPVTVTHLPVTRCQICHRTVAYRPGNLSEVLTGHYPAGTFADVGRPRDDLAAGLGRREPAVTERG